MNRRPPIVPGRWRRTARNLALLGVVMSGVGLVSEVTQALPAGTPAAGTVKLTPATGDSGTTFTLQFDTPVAPQLCPGDNTASYLWHTFITPATNDPAAMTYSVSGVPQGPAFTNNLANAIGGRVKTVQPGLGDGNIIQPTNLSFANALYAPLSGDYWVGIACTLPDNATGTVNTVKFWASVLTITPTAGAGPNGFTYAIAAPQATTTTTTTTTTTAAPTSTTTTTLPVGGTTTTLAGTTTTAAPGGTTTTTVPCPTGTTTTTTVAGATTTTLAGATTTTTTTVPCPTTTTIAAGSGTTTTTTLRVGSAGSGTGTGTVGSAGGSLADTGTSSMTPLVVLWGVLLVLFGRMAILMARPVRVIDEHR